MEAKIICYQCSRVFTPWIPENLGTVEALACDRLCIPCWKLAIQEFVELKSQAEELSNKGTNSKTIDKIMLQRMKMKSTGRLSNERRAEVQGLSH